MEKNTIEIWIIAPEDRVEERDNGNEPLALWVELKTVLKKTLA